MFSYSHKPKQAIFEILDESSFFLTRVKFLGHFFKGTLITTLKSRIEAISKLQPSLNKKAKEMLEMLNFLNKYAYKLRLYLTPFYNNLRQKKI